MAVETGQAIIVAIYTRLTTDATLKSLMGGSVSLYRGMAPQDPTFPYLVHRLASAGWPFSSTPYWLDVWTYNESPESMDSMVERIRTLLENWRITTGASEIGAGRMVYLPEGSGEIPTDNEQVWHYSTAWRIRFVGTRLTGLVG
ncbi:MAG: DUF3168 domain-containing protein [Actinomycetia bacterium]|nr:DUF3168 domain-containing protein [Actinomycetes bacterium]